MRKRIEFSFARLFSHLTARVNGPHASGLFIDSGGLKLVVESTDSVVGKQLRFAGSYGEAEKRRIQQLINTNSSVAFIGTHIGSLAIPTARLVKRALLIEANPHTYKYLQANLKLNGVNNVVAHNIAIGEADGEINFVLSKANSGGSKREPIHKAYMYYYDKPETTQVAMTTFDKLAADFSDSFDLIFMDIEGSEYFALTGMQTSLQKTQHLIVEFIPHHLRNVAGVSADKFLALITPHFSYCYIPSRNRYLEGSAIAPALNAMFDQDESDEGLIFSKDKTSFGA